MSSPTALPTTVGTPTEETVLDGLLTRLTAEEKVSLVVGAGMWSTRGIERIGLAPVVMSDGPVGVRRPDGSSSSAMLPAPSALAATWDVGAARGVGRLFAAEARRHGVHLVLAPQVNLQRTPVAGRHFECYSEDPHLTAEVAVAVVTAAQEDGVGMCVKHYVANDSETDRTRYLARVDPRTLREVYLAPFERLVVAGAWSVMGAYSGVDDGTTAAQVLEHRPLLTGVLKDEWGFDGLVVSDWVATRSVAPAVRGGLDLQMPGPDGAWGDGLGAALETGAVTEADLDDKVRRLLRLAHRVGRLTPPGDDAAVPEGRASRPAPAFAVPEARETFLRELAGRSTVVLQDRAGLLPLPGVENGAPLRVALLGAAAVEPFFQGGGSSFVVPDRLSYPAPALAEALPEGSHLDVVAGSRALRNPPPLDLDRCTDPVTGAPGMRLEVLDRTGAVRRAETRTRWDGWMTDLHAEDVTVRLSARVDVAEQGVHEIGVGTVGVHRVVLDGHEIAAGDVVATEDVILASAHNHPVAATARVTGSSAELVAELQVVHPVGYDRFVRAQLVHRRPGPSAEQELDAAEEAARAADVAVVVVGTTHEVESEGFDRTDLGLPGNQDELVRRVAAVNPRTVVVVNAGAPVLLPWLAEVPTVLWGWLPGQEAGAALADVLTGVTEPSGRLPWTLPARAEDVPVPHAVPADGVVDYTERLDVGYRAWERRRDTDGAASRPEPAAPFGHGLGWTTWSYEAAELLDPPVDPTAGAVVRVRVRNTGPRSGREVVQVYVEPPAGTAVRDPARPVRWLGGFAVVDVAPGGTAEVDVTVPRRALQTWDAHAGWTTPSGTYRLVAGRSVRDLRWPVDVPVHGATDRPSPQERSTEEHVQGGTP
ncbi:glycoside hydrolase family 3 C-terminal domain-containing protein [Isoptericola sp. b515]|uniref:beta-d-glucosidase n=1 Tax=Isoptericola sp. b515 TaxID=3064652 RepID=UPI0027142A94|nr:glycoside hydrolase family 3 C-terminal domain-containing protein [Isoptericola sp. b515]MDO8147222.1 glycoside hydrolase family 3 C-terminal domain-containing protein [Isoptericola sp. b515]